MCGALVCHKSFYVYTNFLSVSYVGELAYDQMYMCAYCVCVCVCVCVYTCECILMYVF